ncbi:hypothetical protein M7I_4486 [Glarea lozoyensis 74030]|uniref:Acyl-CoA N-acyltransferases (Nat) n=1 Tax=Glarea lozoyensis (strain ATCC 74030 / MF5533) TaxID=1104152 RepID=H0EPB4_GLAL7|nr:hypothetical protein M7I_4486 [Glarea lozoyensis 74030]
MSDRFQISEVEESDLEEIALMIQTSSTSSLSPRIVLEFRNVPRSTFLAYNLAGLRSEFNGCASSNGLAEMYKIVDSQIDKIVGFAVWGWDESVCISLDRRVGEFEGKRRDV